MHKSYGIQRVMQMDQSWSKLDTKANIGWFHVDNLQRSMAKVVVKIGSCCSIGISILGNEVIKIDHADGCTMLWMYVVPLNCIFKVTQVENSVIFIWPQYFLKFKKHWECPTETGYKISQIGYRNKWKF